MALYVEAEQAGAELQRLRAEGFFTKGYSDDRVMEALVQGRSECAMIPGLCLLFHVFHTGLVPPRLLQRSSVQPFPCARPLRSLARHNWMSGGVTKHPSSSHLCSAQVQEGSANPDAAERLCQPGLLSRTQMQSTAKSSAILSTSYPACGL